MNNSNLKKVILTSISSLALLGLGGIYNANQTKANTIYATNVYLNGGNNTIGSRTNIHYRKNRKGVKHPKMSYQWRAGIPKGLSSNNGWISNAYRSGKRYVRYTTPFYLSEGFNARPHYYKNKNINSKSKRGYLLNNQGTNPKGAQFNPYYRTVGYHKYQIISGNRSLAQDLDMAEHPARTNYYTPSVAMVHMLSNNSITIFSNGKYIGYFHRMSNHVANELGY